MFVKLYKRTSRSFLDIFTGEKKTQEIIVDMGKNGTWQFSEHQLGHPLKEARVNIVVEGAGYSMDMHTLIDIVKNQTNNKRGRLSEERVAKIT